MARSRKLNSEVAEKSMPSMEELLNQLAEMTRKVEELQKSSSVTTANNSYDEDDEINEIKISPDSYIKVMSLINHDLNLTTEPKGQGIPFRFKTFGEVKRILYSDLVKIMENHRNFLNNGYFFILNKNVIRKHGLNDVYSKILTKENIETILDGNQSDAVNLFSTANPAQQEMIVKNIVSRGVAGFEFDLNLLDRLSRVIGYNIQQKIGEAKSFSEMMKAEREKQN